jgi:hypothetical protein
MPSAQPEPAIRDLVPPVACATHAVSARSDSQEIPTGTDIMDDFNDAIQISEAIRATAEKWD